MVAEKIDVANVVRSIGAHIIEGKTDARYVVMEYQFVCSMGNARIVANSAMALKYVHMAVKSVCASHVVGNIAV